MAFGLLVLRLVIGALFVGHGGRKLFGWFGGPGPDGATEQFRAAGYPEPRGMVRLAGVAELVAGGMLVLGFFTPLAAAAIIGVMINAIGAVHAVNGPWASDGGWEYNAVLVAAAVLFAFGGPGALSIDGALGSGLGGPFWGMSAVLFGVVVGGGVLGINPQAPGVRTEEAPEEATPLGEQQAA